MAGKQCLSGLCGNQIVLCVHVYVRRPPFFLDGVNGYVQNGIRSVRFEVFSAVRLFAITGIEHGVGFISVQSGQYRKYIIALVHQLFAYGDIKHLIGELLLASVPRIHDHDGFRLLLIHQMIRNLSFNLLRKDLMPRSLYEVLLFPARVLMFLFKLFQIPLLSLFVHYADIAVRLLQHLFHLSETCTRSDKQQCE